MYTYLCTLASLPGPARRGGERAWFQPFAHALNRHGITHTHNRVNFYRPEIILRGVLKIHFISAESEIMSEVQFYSS